MEGGERASLFCWGDNQGWLSYLVQSNVMVWVKLFTVLEILKDEEV